jgi:AcrR family transcriptional regulator
VSKQRRAAAGAQPRAGPTRQRILDRAERLFARKGYRGVSIRELARSCGVRPFTIQYHFGSKLQLYQTVLCRWDGDVLVLVSRRLHEARDLAQLTELVVGDLFDFLLSKRDWLRVNVRAGLGEGLPRGVRLEDRSWASFVGATLRADGAGRPAWDPRLLLITIDGILNNHVLAAERYRALFGRDVTDPELRAGAKRHLKRVMLALLEATLPASAGRSASELG